MTSNNVIYTLSTGVSVELSSRKGNRTGYTGAALSPSWTLDATKPFIAACGNPTDEKVMAHINAKARTALHLGYYADAREAAYVVGLFRKDPITTIEYVQGNGSWDRFPEDLYDLPQGLAYEAAIELITSKKLKKKADKKDTSVPASGNLYDFFDRNIIVAIAKSMGGAEAFQKSLVGKTIADFAVEHDLTIDD